jgi:hypothetical protein
MHNMTFALLFLMLSKLSESPILIFGSLQQNRYIPQIVNLIGYFMNNLPLVLSRSDDKQITFFEFIQQCNISIFNNFKYSIVPFREILELLNIQVEANKVPYSSLTFTEVPFVKKTTSSPIIIPTYLSLRKKLGEMDVTVYLYQDIESRWLSFGFEYLVDLYDYSTVYKVIQRFSLIIEHLCQVNLFIFLYYRICLLTFIKKSIFF